MDNSISAFIEKCERENLITHENRYDAAIMATNALRDANGNEKEALEGLKREHADLKRKRDQIREDSDEKNKSLKYLHSRLSTTMKLDATNLKPKAISFLDSTPAAKKENEKLVKMLSKLAKQEFEYGATEKAKALYKVAEDVHRCDTVITSGAQAASVARFIGQDTKNIIDRILRTGKHEDSSKSNAKKGSEDSYYHGDAHIVDDLRNHKARQKRNQRIVDCLGHYGAAHLSSGHRGTGISHLRAAREIQDSDVVIDSGATAKQIHMVGDRIAQKIDQIIREGHVDDEDDYNPGDDDDEEDFGPPQSSSDVPIINYIRSNKVLKKENERIVEALTNYGEEQLKQRHTGTGINYLRAAREILHSEYAIRSAEEARKIAGVGNKVGEFIANIL